MFHVKHDTAPPPPDLAGRVFGDRLELARRYADLLAGPGVSAASSALARSNDYGNGTCSTARRSPN